MRSDERDASNDSGRSARYSFFSTALPPRSGRDRVVARHDVRRFVPRAGEASYGESRILPGHVERNVGRSRNPRERSGEREHLRSVISVV